MWCLVLVRFLPGGSLSPVELFSRLNAKWSYVENKDCPAPESSGAAKGPSNQSPGYGICLADYASIEQLSLDLAIMPGAGISSVEVVPLAPGMESPSLEINLRHLAAAGMIPSDKFPAH
ncbi:MAG: hypothetical protein WC370_09915 [Dehalococcoidales bacterium]